MGVFPGGRRREGERGPLEIPVSCFLPVLAICLTAADIHVTLTHIAHCTSHIANLSGRTLLTVFGRTVRIGKEGKDEKVLKNGEACRRCWKLEAW